MKNIKLYPEIYLIDNGINNSILTNDSNCSLSIQEKAKLFTYYVVEPINLNLKSRKYYDLKSNKNVDLKNKKLESILRNIYDFNNTEKFYLLKSGDEINKMGEWFENRKFPSIETITLERICLKETYGSSKVTSLFSFVRNCVCHGNFEIVQIGQKKKYLVMEDNYGGYIRGRGCISLNTLFSLVEAIKNFSI